MGIKSKMMKAAPKLASRPTRSQRKKDALASKAEAAARAAAEGKRLTWSPRKHGVAMPKRWRREGLAATLRRMPTAGTRSRPSRLKATPQGLSSRKRSR